MRAAMAEARVGDDVFGEDPTVNALQARAAQRLGKEAALFLPTGTMANLVALLAQTRPGDSIILSSYAHPYLYESGNLAMVGGLLPRMVEDPLGKLTAAQVAERIVQTDDPHFAPTTLVSVENTTNRGGGACYTPGELAGIGRVCREKHHALHCDGARLFNAAVALGVETSELAAPCDTVSFCLSKGLGAPAGSLLTGSKETIQRARRFRKMLGGGMRQAGILAAAGLYALDHHIDALAEDHRRARQFREALEPEGFLFPLPSPTNMLFLEFPDAEAARARLMQLGVLVTASSPQRIRVVFHRDIDDEGLGRAVNAFRALR